MYIADAAPLTEADPDEQENRLHDSASKIALSSADMPTEELKAKDVAAVPLPDDAVMLST